MSDGLLDLLPVECCPNCGKLRPLLTWVRMGGLNEIMSKTTACLDCLLQRTNLKENDNDEDN